MNSYPHELLAQLAPVMFVAGLDTAPASVVASNLGSPPHVPKVQDPFQVLTSRLRETLLAQRKVAIWQPEKNKSFQVILVDRDVKFPPRKLVPADDPLYSTAHSPLSPLTPTSPLHPDGLIAPIWIRKHTTLVPSVFVLFLRIFEYPSNASKSSPDIDTDREREAEERKRDSELAADVAQRKKSTNERGIKLTVVLMASRKLLDEPSLDARLSFIRRQSGLDSRAALFVLSPVSTSELNEFVRSLQQALHEPALEYYTAHSKRVRRKRNRHSQTISSHPIPAIGLNIARPLRPEGWTVRYEYKMACFAEFRGEDEVALKHYQDAYEMLTIMFGSTAILPPRTKRWAEAKVLADCINIKTVKLYLYNNEHALALSHHNAHIRVFGDLSRGWGIGEETFEFWSWVARQHRVLAELLEQGLQSTLTLPVHKPMSTGINPTTSQQTIRPAAGMEYDAIRSLGINPSHALQHPGFYYYLAARCTEMRRERFLALAESEISQKPIALSPGYTNEKKVEHLVVINELYTKAYELFKKHSPASAQGQGRLTLWIAYRIAQTYYDAGKYDMAVRFFERIAKTYRREKWSAMLRPLLSTWYACAQQLGNVELSIRLLVEMLGHDAISSEDLSSVEEDLLAVLKSTVPSSPDEILVVDLAEAQPIFDSDVSFWFSEVEVGEEAAFQFRLTAPTTITISSIPFSRVTLYFSEGIPPMVVDHEASDTGEEVKLVKLGLITSSGCSRAFRADLRWQPGSTIVFAGTIASSEPSELKIQSVIVTIEENGWKIDVPVDIHGRRSLMNPVSGWLSSEKPLRFTSSPRERYHSTIVKHREHLLQMRCDHHAPAYLDEDYSIDIEIVNADTRELDVIINVLLQPTEIDDAVNWIVIDKERSSGLIKGIHVGVLAPGVSVIKTLHLFSTGTVGDRMVDISVQTRTVPTRKIEDSRQEGGDYGIEEQQEYAYDTMEHSKMLVVPTVHSIQVVHNVSYRRSLEPWSGLADLQTFEESFWDDQRGGEALLSVLMSCVGPWSLNVLAVQLERIDNAHAKIIDSSTDPKNEGISDFPAEFIAGDEFSASCRVSMAMNDDKVATETPIEGPGQYVVTWQRVLPNGEFGPKTVSHFPLPSLRPPTDELVALLEVPPKATLHEPISLTLTVRNYHPTRSANLTIHLEPESMDSFIVSGLRNGRVPVLLPGSEEKLAWRIVPLECGYVKIPRIKVIDRRKAISVSQTSGEPGAAPEASTGDLVKVIDVRRDRRHEDNHRGDSQPAEAEESEGDDTILVLP